MRILFISDNKSDEDQYRNFLSNLAERDSIFFVYSFPRAISFIKQRMIENQERLDLVIVKGTDYIDREVSFDRFISSNTSVTYSAWDFNLYKIPVVKILRPDSEARVHRFNNYINKYGGLDKELLVEYGDTIIDSVKTWRRSVLDDMDVLGISMNSGVADYSRILSGEKNYSGHTFILSDNFRSFPRKLNYQWLTTNIKQIEVSIDEYVKMLKVHSAKNKNAEELKIHSFFNSNPSFLKRDRYSETHYEAKLPLDRSRYYEPDYTLKTNFNYTTDLSLIEVKLPNERFLKKSEFHQTFYSKVIQHLTQVNDYKDYFEDRLNSGKLEDKYGFLPRNIDYNLLMGREKDLEENREILEKRLRQFGQSYLNLLSYDKLMQYQVAFLDRLKLLEVR